MLEVGTSRAHDITQGLEIMSVKSRGLTTQTLSVKSRLLVVGTLLSLVCSPTPAAAQTLRNVQVVSDVTEPGVKKEICCSGYQTLASLNGKLKDHKVDTTGVRFHCNTLASLYIEYDNKSVIHNHHHQRYVRSKVVARWAAGQHVERSILHLGHDSL